MEREEHARPQREENGRKLREEQGRLAQKKRLAKDRENWVLERKRAIVSAIRQSEERERGDRAREKAEREKEEKQKELERAELEKLGEEEEERLVHEGRVTKERGEREGERSKEATGNGTAANPFVLDDNDNDETVLGQAAAQTQPVVKRETEGEMVRDLTVSIKLSPVLTLILYANLPKVTPPSKALRGKAQTRAPSVTPSARIRATTPASAVSSESSHILPQTPTPAPRARAAKESSAVHEFHTTHRASPSSPLKMRPSSAKRKRNEERNSDTPDETVQKRPKESGGFVRGGVEKAMKRSGENGWSKRKRDVEEGEEEEEGVAILFKKRSRPY